MQIVFGKKFKMECWETCLSTMTVGEVASFKVKKSVRGGKKKKKSMLRNGVIPFVSFQLTYNYPTVAKSLRDSFDPRRHKAGGRNNNNNSLPVCETLY